MATQNATNSKCSLWVAAAVVGSVLIIVAVLARHKIVDWYRATQTEPVPQAVSFTEVSNTNDAANEASTTNSNTEAATTADTNVSAETTDATDEPASDELTTEPTPEPDIIPPVELNLAIPFTSQAPHANWDLPYQEACEEASALMAARFLQGRSIAGADDANSAIVELVNYNVEELGQPIDTTAEQTARIIEEFYDLQADVVYDWTWDDVKQALAQGYPVIFPAAGRELGNPNFTAPGPIYHMLVIKGYTESIVITNDPGTRKGADYQYSYDTLANANHDWNGGDVGNGAKVIIIVQPNNEN